MFHLLNFMIMTLNYYITLNKTSYNCGGKIIFIRMRYKIKKNI